MRKCMSAMLALAAVAMSPAAPARYYITPVEMLEVYGSYRLDNGSILRVTREQRRYWAYLDGARTELVPVASIRFMTPDGSRQFEFIPQAFGTEVRIQ